MYKKILSLLILLSMLLSSGTAFCETSEQTGTYNLSLDDAIDMAVNYSPELQCWDIERQNHDIVLSSAKRAKKENKNTPVYVSQNFEMAYVKSGYYVEAAESQIRLSKIEYGKIINTVSYNVTQKYFNAKNAAKMCEIAASALKRANENLAIIKKQFDIGTCTSLDVDNANIAVLQCEANLDKCTNGYALSLESLKIDLGIEEECQINLTDEIGETDFDADLETDTENAMNTRYDVNGLKEAANLAAMYFKIASGLNDKSTTYFSAYTNSITSRYNFNTGVKNIMLLIKSAYYSVSEAEQNTAIAKQKLDYTKNTYEVNKLRYEMGMITSSVLSALSDELTSAENAYENALLTQKLAVEKYSYEIATGI